jgi:type 1 glutamine amidotransferase
MTKPMTPTTRQNGRCAWILTGGWDGHKPERVADIVGQMLAEEGFDVTVQTRLEALEDRDAVAAVDLLVANWTQGHIAAPALRNWLEAVRVGGTGVAGVHGGMGDAFRNEPAYQEMVGGQWVSHPGGDGVSYTVHIVDPTHPLTRGLSDFTVRSEQYYMHVDPAIQVLATTAFGPVAMPVAWTKRYGQGRVFYCSVGHDPELLRGREMAALLRRGFTWAARERRVQSSPETPGAP